MLPWVMEGPEARVKARPGKQVVGQTHRGVRYIRFDWSEENRLFHVLK